MKYSQNAAALHRGVRRVTSAALLMCQRTVGRALTLATEAALAPTEATTGKTEKETAASECVIHRVLCVQADFVQCQPHSVVLHANGALLKLRLLIQLTYAHVTQTHATYLA